MNFKYCDKNLVHLDFEADDCLSQDEVFELWHMVDIDTKDVPVFEVNLEKDDFESMDFTMYIYISNNDVDEMLDCTFKAVQTLKNREFDAFVSDEDYGGLDVIIVNFRSEHIKIARENIHQRSLRVCPECGERKAHPHSSKYVWDRLLFKYHCENCGYAYVGLGNGKFIREGDLLADWEIAQMRGY